MHYIYYFSHFSGIAPDGVQGIVTTLTSGSVSYGWYLLQSNSGVGKIKFGIRNYIRDLTEQALFDYPALNQWTHYVMTMQVVPPANPPVFEIFKDGQVQTFGPGPSSQTNPDGVCDKIVIGRKYVNIGGNMAGNVEIDELMLFERALTQVEADVIYQDTV